MATFWEESKKQLGAFAVASVIALATIFSDEVAERVKFAVNRADYQFANFEKLATDLSDYTYTADVLTEYYEKGWTTKSSLTVAVVPYNKAIVTLRKREHVNQALLRKYWHEKTVNDFSTIMQTVRAIDQLIHALNVEAEPIAIGAKKKADPKVTRPITAKIRPLIKTLEVRLVAFLSELT